MHPVVLLAQDAAIGGKGLVFGLRYNRRSSVQLINPMQSSSRCYHGSAASLADHYSVLGVSRRATEKDIKQAYLVKAKLYHPDLNTKDDQKEAADKFRRIQHAYETLGDAQKKRVYDQGNLGGSRYNRNLRAHSQYGTTAYSPSGSAHARKKTGPVDPKHFNMKKWEDHHYGDEKTDREIMGGKPRGVNNGAPNKWMNEMESEGAKHQNFFRKKVKSDTEAQFHAAQAEAQKNLKNEAAASLNRQREERRKRGKSTTTAKASGASDGSSCVIS